MELNNEQTEQISEPIIESEIDKVQEAIREESNTNDIEFILETEKSMTRERKIELIKWTEIKKFHDQLDTRQEENLKIKERSRIKLMSSTKEKKLIDEEWEEIWQYSKATKKK
jgi:hypothetical protein